MRLPVQELRIHGVSGTPPREILYTDPVPAGGSGTSTQIYKAPPTDPSFDTSAFHWANLTSGSRLTALWILLAPYALANTAGWMAGWERDPTTETGPGDPQSWHRKLGRMSIRSAGLALTALFVAQALTAGVLLPMRWLAQTDSVALGPVTIGLSIDRRVALTILVTLVALLFYWLAAIVSTRSHFTQLKRTLPRRLLLDLSGNAMTEAHYESRAAADTAVREDPGGALITDGRLWSVHAMLHRLRRMHLSAGFLVISIGLGAWTGRLPIGLGLGTALVVFGIFGWLTTYKPGSDLSWRIGALSPHFSIVLLAIAVFGVWNTDPGGWAPESFHALTFGIAIILAVFALGSMAAGPLSLGAMVLATFFGVVLGTTVGLAVDEALSTDELIGHGVGWVAVAMLALIAWLMLVATALAFIGQQSADLGATAPLPRGWRSGGLVLLRRIVLEARVLFYASGLFGVASAIYVFAAIWSHGRGRGAVGLWETLSGGLDPAALGTFPQSLVNTAVTIAIIGPGYFALRSIRKGWISEEAGRSRRRQVGILWDLGSFWPRWYHPLAPPGYGPSAVDDLSTALEGLREGSVAGAHSQGSLIIAVALHRTRRPVTLITYGSQLGLLYPRMFPAAGIPELVASLDSSVPHWVNLWRATDFIGGQSISILGARNWRVSDGRGHSRYELTSEYLAARRLSAAAAPEPSEETMPSSERVD